jgi:hypothetical protein
MVENRESTRDATLQKDSSGTEFLFALRCIASRASQNRACWEHLRASLRRKDGKNNRILG